MILAAQNTVFRGPAQMKLWLKGAPYIRPSDSGASTVIVKVPSSELGLLLSAPSVDYSVTFPPGITLSAYFPDPADDAAANRGLLVAASPSVEVSPAMMLARPKVTSVMPRMVPWPDRSNRANERTEDPSFQVIGLGFVNTKRLRCRLVDSYGGITDSPFAVYISQTEVRCSLPPYKLPGSVDVKMQVSNDGAEWSEETFLVYIVSALELRRVLSPSFGPTGGNTAVQVSTIGCLYGLGFESHSQAIFLGENDILCLGDQPVSSLGLRKAGGQPSGGSSDNQAIGFRLTLAPKFGNPGDPRLVTSEPTGFVYSRTPSFNTLVPNFGAIALPVTVTGQDFPFGLAEGSGVRCRWGLTREVTNGHLISGSALNCTSPTVLPRVQLMSVLGVADTLTGVSFDGGRNFHQVAATGLPFTILHRGTGPLAARLYPTYARSGRGGSITLYGGDFQPLKRLAPAFGYCTFSWNLIMRMNLTNDTGSRTSPAVFISQREVSCKVPLDLPPAIHAVQLFFEHGGSRFEARYGIPAGKPWLNLTVLPSFSMHQAQPSWAPVAALSQVSVTGSRFTPTFGQDVYWCSFGSAPQEPAIRVSLGEVVCQTVRHRAQTVALQISMEDPGRTLSQLSEKPFTFVDIPIVHWVRPVIVLAHQRGQTLRIGGLDLRKMILLLFCCWFCCFRCCCCCSCCLFISFCMLYPKYLHRWLGSV
ncbi:unnamed protein product [Polarella glacialis]|uniref:IPT/TIG domain-containing protein n=1 Tax=Polarella glacialis TaxID=89957 RepID=A0A813FLA8_POLGL|nr:unnamed protein product [Polarella glacialis]